MNHLFYITTACHRRQGFPLTTVPLLVFRVRRVYSRRAPLQTAQRQRTAQPHAPTDLTRCLIWLCVSIFVWITKGYSESLGKNDAIIDVG